jgi:hypothetical protein
VTREEAMKMNKGERDMLRRNFMEEDPIRPRR